MVTFRVRASSLSEVAALLQGVVLTFDAHVAETETAVSNVVDSTWKGEDADLFKEQWDTWKTGAALTRQAITNLITKLYAAESGYNVNESGLKQGFSRRMTVNEKQVGRRVDSISGHVERGTEIGEDLAEETETYEDDKIWDPDFVPVNVAATTSSKGGPSEQSDDSASSDGTEVKEAESA